VRAGARRGPPRRARPGRPGVTRDRRRAGDGSALPLYAGSAVTPRPAGSRFTFALITDPHISPRDPVPAGADVGTDFYGDMESTLLAVNADIAVADPDFIVNMGDTLDFHILGQFNGPPPDAHWTRLGYLNYRRLLGDTLGRAAHFPVIGNWDGESGCDPEDGIERSRSQRLLYVPGPHPDTYPEGGSPNEDYYAFTWGDALFVVLNVMTYTPTCHLLGNYPGLPDDWTLGPAQMAWLQETLARATSKWRFTFIHHTVGGAAGNADNSAYGRGGGQAAHVGEQAVVHDLLMRYGVQVFFYGHDHVFTDMVVDGVHYTLPGSAGAPWKFTAAETGYAQYWPDSGYGRVTVSPDEADVDFVAIGGQVLASYTLR
jgi:3',5'-cyclic AMP phosphodiesterase CpdA